MQDDGADGEPLLECRGLHKHYRLRDRSIRVLEGVELSVRRGEVVVITGRTGAGKSTLLGLLGGLDRPSSGSILLEGRRVDDLGGSQWSAIRRRKVGFLFQNVEAALLHADVPRAQRRARAEALLAALGLADRLEHLPAELSVGQQQLVAIARALANEPSLLLADEPTGDVDSDSAREIIAQLTAPVRARGAALVVATHGAFPLAEADRAFLLADGVLAPLPWGPAAS
jgi:ABC-type lipoprotein export system ATPase subunit